MVECRVSVLGIKNMVLSQYSIYIYIYLFMFGYI